MPAIGYFARTENGFKGNLRTLSIKAPTEIAHNANKTAEKQPDYLIFVEGVEVGAAWNRVANTSGNEYVSLQLAAPEFGPRKLYANLGVAAGQDAPGTFAFIWNSTDQLPRAALRGGPHFSLGVAAGCLVAFPRAAANRPQSLTCWPLRYVPDGRSSRVPRSVPKHPAADRQTTSTVPGAGLNGGKTEMTEGEV